MRVERDSVCLMETNSSGQAHPEGEGDVARIHLMHRICQRLSPSFNFMYNYTKKKKISGQLLWVASCTKHLDYRLVCGWS